MSVEEIIVRVEKHMANEIPLKKLERKNPETGVVEGSITPVLKVVERGEMAGNVYPCIEVTEENFNDYVKFRTNKAVLDVLNARERADAQGTLDHVLDDTDWEETGKDKAGKAIFTYNLPNFLKKIDTFWEELTSGKIKGGVTIVQLEEELEDLVEAMKVKIIEMQKSPPDKIRAAVQEAAEISAKHKNLEAQIEDIRRARKPRMTKAEKEAQKAAATATAVKAA